MRLILDTVTFIWAVSAPERLSRTAMSAFRKGTAVREISVVSLAEIAINQSRGKLNVSKADAMTGVADLRMRILPYTADHTFQLFRLRHVMPTSPTALPTGPGRGRRGLVVHHEALSNV